MNKLLIYTFRTFPRIEELRKLYPELFVFGKLRNDFDEFKVQIQLKQPTIILGIGRGKTTRFESIALNKFNQNRINKQGRESYKLFVPKIETIPTAVSGTTSFCNWTMYKVAEFIEQEKLSTHLTFLHVDKQIQLESLLAVTRILRT